MKVCVINEKCIGCGSCVSVTDEKIFDFNEEGMAYAKVENVSEDDMEIVKTAMDYCPTSAITMESEDNKENASTDNSINKDTN